KSNLTSTCIDSSTDEISTDEKVRKASRSFRQTFDISPTERLVNCNKIKRKEKKGGGWESRKNIDLAFLIL
ncbi:MAG: hypothetical protein EXX96DRAFT_491700, partial [Benjaminiella poitrasii]